MCSGDNISRIWSIAHNKCSVSPCQNKQEILGFTLKTIISQVVIVNTLRTGHVFSVVRAYFLLARVSMYK